MKKLVKMAKALYRDEDGADMMEYVLIFAAVALPLLGIIIWFRNDIYEWAQELWEGLKSEAEEPI